MPTQRVQEWPAVKICQGQNIWSKRSLRDEQNTISRMKFISCMLFTLSAIDLGGCAFHVGFDLMQVHAVLSLAHQKTAWLHHYRGRLKIKFPQSLTAYCACMQYGVARIVAA
jgi:hypothetical protein